MRFGSVSLKKKKSYFTVNFAFTINLTRLFTMQTKVFGERNLDEKQIQSCRRSSSTKAFRLGTCVRWTMTTCVFLDFVKTKTVFQSTAGHVQPVSILRVTECHERRKMFRNRNVSIWKPRPVNGVVSVCFVVFSFFCHLSRAKNYQNRTINRMRWRRYVDEKENKRRTRTSRAIPLEATYFSCFSPKHMTP